MITRVYINNFKGLRDFTIDFTRPFTAIAGRNGAGKTSICQALDLLGRLVNARPADVMSELDADLIRNKWAPSSNIVLEVDAEIPWMNAQTASKLKWRLGISKKKGWGIAEEEVTREGADIPGSPGYLPSGCVLRRKWRKISVFNCQTTKWEDENKELPSYISTVSEETKQKYPDLYDLKQNLLFRYIPFLNPVFLRQRTRETELGSQGENFASYLHQFSRSNKTGFEEVTRQLINFFPRLRSLRPTRSKFGWTEVQVTQEILGDKDVTFRAGQVNDGLLRLAAIATLPYADKSLRLVIIEEPENGMHPRLLDQTVQLLRSFSQHNLQVIVTTHSPVLLNFLKPEETIVLCGNGKSGPKSKRFSELPSGLKRLNYFDIGDVIYEVGEEKLLK